LADFAQHRLDFQYHPNGKPSTLLGGRQFPNGRELQLRGAGKSAVTMQFTRTN
jgi:hypothetical protein